MTTKAEKVNLAPEFARVLGCSEKYIHARMISLGHYEHCSRCGGCGQYSWCQMWGDRCFKCGGSGKTQVKLTAKLLAQVTEEVAAGKLQPYLDAMKVRAEAKNADKRFLEAWRSNPLVAQYSKVHFTECPEEHHAVNFAVAPLHDLMRDLQYALQYGKRWTHLSGRRFDARDKDNPEYNRQITDADKLNISKALIEIVEYAGKAEQLLREGEGLTREAGDRLAKATVARIAAIAYPA